MNHLNSDPYPVFPAQEISSVIKPSAPAESGGATPLSPSAIAVDQPLPSGNGVLEVLRIE